MGLGRGAGLVAKGPDPRVSVWPGPFQPEKSLRAGLGLVLGVTEKLSLALVG